MIGYLLAGLSLLQGYSSYQSYQQNAEAAEAWGHYNAGLARKYAEFNAQSIEQLGALNAQMIYQSSESQALITEALAQYNATLRVQTAEYNAQLLEKEAALVWEAQELDQITFAREAETRLKAQRTHFASSGIEINTGSPLDYMVDQSTQAHLESFVIAHNADIEMSKILDAAALSRWEGQAEAAQLVFQGQMDSASLRLEGQMESSMTSIQSFYDSIMARFEGEIRAEQILSEALWSASQSSRVGVQSAFDALFQGASWAARDYGND